jgi:hypothetical protein
MLVIDGKYNNDDGLSIGTMCQACTQKYFAEMQQSKLVKTRRDSVEVHTECRVCLSLMERSEYAVMEKQGQCKLRRESPEVHTECKSVLVHLMENI